MNPLTFQLVLLEVAVMLLNAGGSSMKSDAPVISTSLTHMTLGDCTELKCEIPQDSGKQCSFITGTNFNLSSQSHECELIVSGKQMWRAGQDTGNLKNVVTVYCQYFHHGKKSIMSSAATVEVWKTTVPISCLIVGLAVSCFLIVLVLISACLLCISLSKHGCGAASTRRYKCCGRISEEQKLDPADDQGDQKIKKADDEIQYASVTFTPTATNKVKSEQCPEYATVVFNAQPSPSTSY